MLNECSRIQSLPNWTLKGTGSPKASGRLLPTNNTNNNDDPIFMKEALLSTHRQLPFKSPTHAIILHSLLLDQLFELPQKTLLVVAETLLVAAQNVCLESRQHLLDLVEHVLPHHLFQTVELQGELQ